MAIDFPASPVNGQVFGTHTYDSSVPGWRKTPELASGLPAGTIVQWPGATAPANWMIADGSAISRTTYASLFSAIGTQYGAGDGSTTFNLPNLKGRVAVGLDSLQSEFNVLGETGGAKTHTLTTAEIPTHSHPSTLTSNTVASSTHTHGSSTLLGGAYVGYWATRTAGNWTATNTGGFTAPGGNTTNSNQGLAIFGSTDAPSATTTVGITNANNTGGDGAHNNLQPYIVLNYIIKLSAGITAGDSELATRVGTTESGIVTLQGRVGTTESGIVTLQGRATTVEGRATTVESKIGFNSSVTFTASTTWTVPTLANKIVKVTVIGAGGGGGWDGQNVGGTGGTSTFSATSGSISAAGGGRGAGATGNATGAPSTAGLASGNNGSGRGGDNAAVNIGGPGTGGKISIGYINLTSVSTATITIGAPGTAGGASATAGGRGEIIVEYGV